MRFTRSFFGVVFSSVVSISSVADAPQGYYREPAIHKDVIVFCAEGDLWIRQDGVEQSRRLTTHLGEESDPAISPDGTTVAFSAQYDGPTEVYTMPVDGGLPMRRTWDGGRAVVIGWTPDGAVLYTTRSESSLPDYRLVRLDPNTNARSVVPLSQAADGSYDPDSGLLFFVRLPFQGSFTKRYKGGTAQQIWKFDGVNEAVPLTSDYAGTSKEPMVWNGRVYFVSDRDNTMNIWSMNLDGGDLQQHTKHDGFDVQSPSLDDGRIVYQLGADLWRYDIDQNAMSRVVIDLGSDFDQMRKKWIDEPMDWVTSAHLSPDGNRVALTARGQVFIAPRKQGRLIEVTRDESVRHRDARFMPDGTSVLTLSDQSGEVEFWTFPAVGFGESKQLTSDGEVLRWEGVPSPDGAHIAHHDKNLRLWLLRVEDGTELQIDSTNVDENFDDLTWSPDSRWLAYSRESDNWFRQIWLYRVEDGAKVAVTSDRQLSFSPAWSPDGSWLYFLSRRHLQSTVGSPWGARAPKPYFDDETLVYAVALTTDAKFPFLPLTELDEVKKDKKDENEHKEPDESAPDENDEVTADEEEKKALIELDIDGLSQRLYQVPIAPGNYASLNVTNERLFWLSRESGKRGGGSLMTLKIDREPGEPKSIMDGVSSVEMSLDRKWMLIRRREAMHIAPTNGSPVDAKETQVNLGGWTFAVDPAIEWRQMFVEAWRLERDYFYDRNMHGVDWPAMLQKYLPLVERVRTRDELNDLIAQMVAELSALHIFVRGGDTRDAPAQAMPASLGAELRRSEALGGFVIEHITSGDPEYPDQRSPLAEPHLNVHKGDTIVMINGVRALDAADVGALLQNQAGRQVRLRLKDAATETERDVIVIPVSPAAAADLRYDEWEYQRRQRVEEAGDGEIGYVHLRAMGSRDIGQWTRDFYPVFNRKGLILDVRHNGGGNIDAWILNELQKKSWFFWKGRAGEPYWNMQYAFRGHLVILCDERTGSDGEAITEGVRRLNLGTIMGTRTWGGEIWLSSSNVLVDRGIATAAEYGVYGPEGVWLIEGHGVDPDIVIDNLPHATFNGEDAQLKAAVEFLKRKIVEEPVEVPAPPPHPDKSVNDNRRD